MIVESYPNIQVQQQVVSQTQFVAEIPAVTLRRHLYIFRSPCNNAWVTSLKAAVRNALAEKKRNSLRQ